MVKSWMLQARQSQSILQQYDPKRIAVERNGDIVPKAQYPDTVLEDGDSVEVVSFVGGG